VKIIGVAQWHQWVSLLEFGSRLVGLHCDTAITIRGQAVGHVPESLPSTLRSY